MKANHNSSRPVYLNLFAFKFPITAILSIIHRITGVLLFFGLVPIILLWHTSLQNEAGFALAQELSAVIFIRLFLWAYACVLFYHVLAGIKHLFMDLGWGDSLETASILSWGIMLISILFAALLVYLMFFV